MLELLPTTEPTATLFKVTIVLLIALAGHRLLRPASAGVRHLWSTLAIAALVAVPLLSLALPNWSVTLPVTVAPSATPPATVPSTPRSPVEAASAPKGVVPEPAVLIPADGSAARHETVTISVLASDTSATPREEASAAKSTAVPSNSAPATSWSRGQILLAIWAAGALLLLARLAVGALRVARWVARAEEPEAPRLHAALAASARRIDSRIPRLRVSDRSRVPLLWGWIRPTVLLPRSAETWSEDRLRVVLTHELAHLERGDWLTLLLGRVTVALYWFHPLAWVLEGQARRDCEEACDDRVLTSGTLASDYARHLLDLAQSLQLDAPRPAVALIRPSQVEQRLRAILRPDRSRQSPTRRLVLLAAVASTVLLAPLASVRLEAWDPGPSQRVSLLEGPAATAPIPTQPIRVTPDPPLLPKLGEVFHEHLAQLTHSPDGDTWKVERSRDREPDSGKGWFELAWEYHRSEDYEEAAKAFQHAADAGYRPGTAAYNAACGLARTDQRAEAMQWLERSLNNGFDDYDYLFEDSDLDSLRGTREFMALLDRYREEAGSWRRPAIDRLEQTEGAYDKLVASGSENGDFWHDVGTDFLSLGQYDRAIEALERSVELDPHQSSATRYNLACAFSRAGQTENALVALDAAVEWGFDSEERFRNDRDIDAIRGTSRFEEIRHKAQTLDLSRFRNDGWWDPGQRIDPKIWKPAVATYRAFVDEYPNSGRGWFNLGYSLHYSGDHDEAIRAFDRALQLDFKPSLQMYNIACAHARMGSVEPALQWLERAGEAGMDIASSMGDDEDFDAIRDDERFRELEKTYWIEEKRRHLIEHKEQLEQKLKQLGEAGQELWEAEMTASAEARAQQEQLAAEWTRRKATVEAERVEVQQQRWAERQQRDAERVQTRAEMVQRLEEREQQRAEELARLAAELEAKRAALLEQKAELEAARAKAEAEN